MEKYLIKVKKLIVIILVLIYSCKSTILASVVDSFDGGAFVTKAEFSQLQDELKKQVDYYNTSLDNKVDGVIANYIASLRVNSTTLISGLSKLSENRRTFVQSIANPTTSGQDDIYISTNGFWVWGHATAVGASQSSQWAGYAFAGLNNYNSRHTKKLDEKNNGKSGKYMFIDKMKVGNPVKEVKYIYDSYRKYLQYKITSCGAQVQDGYTGARPDYGGPSSITWDATYNWVGQNTRQCSSISTMTVPALESIILLVNDDDYDTSKDGTQEVDWVSKTSGSTIFNSNMGSLLKTDQYNWSYDKTSFHIGQSAKQALTYQASANSQINSFNPSGQYINLNFKVPKITMLKGDEIAIEDVSSVAGEAAYYFSGLPLLTLPKTADKLVIRLKAKINRPSSTPTATSGLLIAIKNKQFNNIDINSEAVDDIVYKKEWTTDTLPESPDTITIELDYEQIYNHLNKQLWIKAIATNTSCTVTLTPDVMYYY